MASKPKPESKTKYKPGWLMKKVPSIRYLGIKYLERTSSLKILKNELKNANEGLKVQIYARLSTGLMLADSRYGKAFGDLNIYRNIKKPEWPGMLKDALISAFKELKQMSENEAVKMAAEHFKNLNLSFEIAVKAGFGLKTLYDARYPFKVIEKHVENLAVLRKEGFTVDDFIENQKSFSDIKKAGFTIEELEKSKYGQQTTITSPKSISALKAAGYTATDFKKANFTLGDIVHACNEEELFAAGYPIAGIYIQKLLQGLPKQVRTQQNIMSIPLDKRVKVAENLIDAVKKTKNLKEAKGAPPEVCNALSETDKSVVNKIKKKIRIAIRGILL